MADVLAMQRRPRRAWWLFPLTDGRWAAALYDNGKPVDRIMPDRECRVAMLLKDRHRGLPIIRQERQRAGAA